MRRVDAAEQWLFDRGFRTVRVRVAGEAGDTARIELAPSDIMRLVELPMREEAVHAFKDIGFAYVAIDLRGYRTGSMNEAL